ncbi:hypothetical protein DSO57_1034985 [Entomophthora muscae]|nr:hypothetical protein DSO57_1034985 [Entomophthora muscae]
MSFLHGLSQFNDCIESTSALLRLSATSPLRPTFHFVSSIGAALPVMKKNPIPEKELSTQLTQGGLITGYNLSKLVAEVICCRWSRQFKFPLHIHRVGQIVGDTLLGAWNTKEHIPLLIKASQVMGILPNKLTPYISWIPVDVAAQAMVELNTSFLPIDAPIVHHIANPNLIPWELILDLLHAAGLQFKHVSPKHFFNTLYNTPKYQDPTVNPLASLTQFWDSLLSPTSTSHLLQTTFTAHHSSVIRHCPEMDAPLVQKFIHHWIQTGFLTHHQ